LHDSQCRWKEQEVDMIGLFTAQRDVCRVVWCSAVQCSAVSVHCGWATWHAMESQCRKHCRKQGSERVDVTVLALALYESIKWKLSPR